jgi:cytochrome c oxidase cbb3-type subunit III
MKFINYLESITGVSIFPMLSLMIFFLFFLSLIIYATKILSRESVSMMEQLPLQDTTVNNIEQ